MRRSLASALIGSLALLSSALVTTGAAAAPGGKVIPGVLTGTVLEPDNSTVAGGVTVTAFQNTSTVDPWSLSLTPRGSVVTDSSGAFTIGRLPPGEYRVKLTPPAGSGFAWRFYDDDDDVSGSPWHGQPVTLLAGQSLALDPVRLFESGTATGQVVAAESGAPLAGMTVTLMVQGPGQLLDVATATTDADGWFLIGGLPPSGGPPNGCQEVVGCELNHLDYWPWVSDPQGWRVPTQSWGPGEPAWGALAEGAAITLPDPVRLEPAGKVSGVVLDVRGRPIAGVDVFTLYPYVDWNGEIRWMESGGWIQTDRKGRFTMGGVPIGTVRIGVRDERGVWATEYWPESPVPELASSVVVRAGQVTLLGSAFVLEPGATVSGVISGPDLAPLSDLYVHALYQVDTEWYDLAWAGTDRHGSYAITGLPAGTYRMFMDTSVDGSYYYAEEFREQLPGQGDHVVLTAGERRTGVDEWLNWAVVHATGTVTGDNDNNPGTPPGPIQGAQVDIVRMPTTPGGTPVVIAQPTWTDGSGGFDLRVAFPAGSTALRVTVPWMPGNVRWLNPWGGNAMPGVTYEFLGLDVQF